MTFNITNRKEVRESLCHMIQSVCPSAQAVYDYQKSNIDAESPIIRVISQGTNTEALTLNVMNVKLIFSIQIIVLYDDPNNPGYTEDIAEDVFDDVWTEVVNFIATNTHSSEHIRDIRPIGNSGIEKFILEGSTYITELFPVEVQLK